MRSCGGGPVTLSQICSPLVISRCSTGPARTMCRAVLQDRETPIPTMAKTPSPIRAPAGTIVHSDRGSQFRSKRVVRLLKNNGLRGSMGRVGSSSDNAAMESFFSLLQKNVLNTRRWNTREELRLAIVVWIETKYNRRRRQRGLGKLTPVEFETIYTAANAA
jgi:transposase InsO family protein